jgi:hypothetical protein
MMTGIILGACFLALMIWGSGKSSRRRELDERGVGPDTPPQSSEQLYDPNSFEHTSPPGH